MMMKLLVRSYHVFYPFIYQQFIFKPVIQCKLWVTSPLVSLEHSTAQFHEEFLIW